MESVYFLASHGDVLSVRKQDLQSFLSHHIIGPVEIVGNMAEKCEKLGDPGLHPGTICIHRQICLIDSFVSFRLHLMRSLRLTEHFIANAKLKSRIFSE